MLGRGVGDAEFLAEHGAELIITDLKNEVELAPSLKRLNKFSNITYHLEGHHLEDFRNRPKSSGDDRGPDFILKSAGVPLDSPFIAKARKNKIPIEMDASLFAKLAPKGVTIIGVTGTRGKSTTTALIFEILSLYVKGQRSIVKGFQSVFMAGNVRGVATLPLLKEVKKGDFVVLELDSWQLQGFGEAKISPRVAVFTNFLDDHLNYYKGDQERYFNDKANIFRFQKKGLNRHAFGSAIGRDDILVVGKQALKLVLGSHPLGQDDLIIARATDVPKNWKIKLLGEHNRANIACALAVARALGVPDNISHRVVEKFKGVPGRLELIRTIRWVKIYNDNNATTPDATLAALRALSLNSSFSKGGGESSSRRILEDKSLTASGPLPLEKGESTDIVLIMGGTDKGLDMSKLMEEIPKYCKAVVFLKESGTEKLISNFSFFNSSLRKGVSESERTGDVLFFKKATLKECVEQAMEIGQKGDIVLFSPAFASFGKWFKNEYDRGEQFVEIVKKLKNLSRKKTGTIHARFVEG